MGVFVAYAGARGYTLVDRVLYLPQAWTRDPACLQGVGLAPDTAFATKPQLARRMLARGLDAGLPAVWVTGDSVYGHAGDLRRLREDRGQASVLAVPRNEPVWRGWEQVPVKAIHATLAEENWQRRSAGATSKGQCGYAWPWVQVGTPRSADTTAPRVCSLWFRRSCTDPSRGTAYRVYAPRDTDWDTVVQVAGTCGCVESSFETAKGEVGLDAYEVRNATGGYWHMTLALWALALLAAVRADPRPQAWPAPGGARPGLGGLAASPPVGGPELPLPPPGRGCFLAVTAVILGSGPVH